MSTTTPGSRQPFASTAVAQDVASGYLSLAEAWQDYYMPYGFLSEVDGFREAREGENYVRVIRNDRLERECGSKNNPAHILENLTWGNQPGRTACAYSITPLGSTQYVFEECSFPSGAGWTMDTDILDPRVTDQVCRIALVKWNMMDRRDQQGSALPLGMTYFGANLDGNTNNPDPLVFFYGLKDGSSKEYHPSTDGAAADRFEPTGEQQAECGALLGRRGSQTQDFVFGTWSGFVDPTKNADAEMGRVVKRWMDNVGTTADACFQPSPDDGTTLTFNDMTNALYRLGSFVIEKPDTVRKKLSIKDTNGATLDFDGILAALKDRNVTPDRTDFLNRKVAEGLLELKEAKCVLASQAAIKVCTSLPYAATKESMTDFGESCGLITVTTGLLENLEFGSFESLGEVVDTLNSAMVESRISRLRLMAARVRCDRTRQQMVSVVQNLRHRLEDTEIVGGKDKTFCGAFRNLEFGCGIRDPAVREMIIANAESMMPEVPPLPPTAETLMRRSIQRSFTVGSGSEAGCTTKQTWDANNLQRDMARIYKNACEQIQGELQNDIDKAMTRILNDREQCTRFRTTYEIEAGLMKCDGTDLQGGLTFLDKPQLRAEVLKKVDNMGVCQGPIGTGSAPAAFVNQCAARNLSAFTHTAALATSLCTLAGDFRDEAVRLGRNVCQ